VKIMIDKVLYKKLISDVKCYIIPKAGYIEKQAMVAVNYGSINNSFEVDGQIFDFPKGTAHFLEHKLFEDEHINVFEEFSKLGASVNAFTNFNTTAYYFNCNDNFDKSFKLLLDFVSKPYFTDENVEKEKGIIKQEIKMYEDDFSWQVYFNMLNTMYFNNPVKYNIAGNIKSINDINKEVLYKCYESFYTLNNSVVICCGDFDEKEIDNIINTIDKNLKFKKSSNVKKIYDEEPDKVKNEYVENKMTVDKPIFNIGFKENVFSCDILKKMCASKILLDIIMGESSDLFNKLYNDNIVDNSFSYEYLNGINFGASIVSGISENPIKVKEILINEIYNLKNNGIEDNHFKRIKLKHIGRFIRGFNSIDAIVTTQADLFTKNINIEDVYKMYKNISLEDIYSRLQALDKNLMVLSVIKPQ